MILLATHELALRFENNTATSLSGGRDMEYRNTITKKILTSLVENVTPNEFMTLLT